MLLDCASTTNFVSFDYIRTITLNANGLSDKCKRTQLFRYLRLKEIDIACIQETHFTESKKKIIKNEWGGQVVYSNGESNARGVAILIAKKMKIDKIKSESDCNGRIVQLSFQINDATFKIINVYAPNDDKPEFFSDIFDKMQKSTEDHILLMGDFNVYLNDKIDKRGGTPSNSKTAQVVNAFLKETDWIDVWRATHGNQFQYTWKRRHPLIMHRLDYVLADLGTMNLIKNCEISAVSFSDHLGVITDISINPNFRGPGLWKFNNQHLNNEEFVKQMNYTLDMVDFRYENLNPINKWEMIQHDMQEVATNFSRIQGAKRKQNLKLWNNQLTAAQKKLAMINLSSDKAIEIIEKTNEKIDKIKSKLQKEAANDAQGAILRAKARWTSQAEHGTRYFYSLEKRNAKSKVMNETFNDKGELVNNPKEVLAIQSRFYEKLYTSNPNIKCNINVKPERKLTELQKIEMDKEVTLDEVQQTIKQMARGKSPGTSGFSIDIFIVFWIKLKEHFMEMFKYILETGYMNRTALTGIITLIPKKRKKPEIRETLETYCFTGHRVQNYLQSIRI